MIDPVPDPGRSWPWHERPEAERPPVRRCTWIVGPPGGGRTSALRVIAARARASRHRDPIVLDDLYSRPDDSVLETITNAGPAPLLVSSSAADPVPADVVRALRSLGVDRRELVPLSVTDVAHLLSRRWGLVTEHHTAARVHTLSGGRIGVLRAVVDDAVDAGVMSVRHGMLRLRGDFPLSRAVLHTNPPEHESGETARVLDCIAVADGLPVSIMYELGGRDTAEELLAAGRLLPDDSTDLVRMVPEIDRYHRKSGIGPGLRRHRLWQVDQAAEKLRVTSRELLRPRTDLPRGAGPLHGPWHRTDDPGVEALEVLSRSGSCVLVADPAGDAGPSRTPAGSASAMHDLVVAALAGDVPGLESAASSLRDLAAADPRVAGGLGLFNSYGLLISGQTTEALAAAEEFRRRHQLSPRLAAVASLALANVLVAAGDLGGARQCFFEAAAEFRDEPDSGWTPLVACGLAYVGSLLDDSRSKAVAAHLVEGCHPEWGLFAAPRAAARAWAIGRDDAEVAAGLADAYRAAVERGQTAMATVFAMELIRTGGEPAARYIESTPPGAPEIDDLSRYRAAVLAGDLGELECVAAEFRERDIRVFAVALYARLAAAHRQAGRRADAAEAAAIARDLSRRSGGIELPSLQLLASVAELSPREREVAVSVSRGQSNRAIAADLGLSVRTVEGHVMRACRRLDVASRSELAEAIRLVRR